ncbi:MAG TPA: ATP-binding cassette domain-containing protein [Thermoanaerobaculia bacterium]
MNVIETQDLTKRYGRETLAVDRVSLEVGQGQVFGFLGPNGSGKTTTIGMLLGVITPTAGAIRLFGAGDARGLQHARLRIGATLEQPNFYPYMSGLDNLRIVANVKGAPRREIDRVLDVTGLAARRRSKFRTYSLGMKQRLALAAALLNDPDLVVLDEPANGLDPDGMREIREIVTSLADDGKTVFLSSHLLSEVERMCTHAAIVSRGRIVRRASVAELIAGSTVVELKAADPDLLRQAVAMYPGATLVERRERVVVANLSNDDTAALNRWLGERGLYVSHLARRTRTLEDAFMDATRADTTPAANSDHRQLQGAA